MHLHHMILVDQFVYHYLHQIPLTHMVLVINYHCPNHYEDYVHRVGRTGRAGRKGTSYTFITPEDDAYAGDMIQALKMAKLIPFSKEI